MRLVKEINGVASPYSFERLYADYYHISWPKTIPAEMLEEYGVYYVHERPIPAPEIDYDPLIQDVQEHPVRKTATGNYILEYSVIDKPSEQMIANIKQKRDDLLAESDGMLMRLFEQYDFDMERIANENLAEPLKKYRRALRDLPKQDSWPFDLDWPDKP